MTNVDEGPSDPRDESTTESARDLTRTSGDHHESRGTIWPYRPKPKQGLPPRLRGAGQAASRPRLDPGVRPVRPRAALEEPGELFRGRQPAAAEHQRLAVHPTARPPERSSIPCSRSRRAALRPSASGPKASTEGSARRRPAEPSGSPRPRAERALRERAVEIVGAAGRIEHGERRVLQAGEPVGAVEHGARRRGVEGSAMATVSGNWRPTRSTLGISTPAQPLGAHQPGQEHEAPDRHGEVGIEPALAEGRARRREDVLQPGVPRRDELDRAAGGSRSRPGSGASRTTPESRAPGSSVTGRWGSGTGRARAGGRGSARSTRRSRRRRGGPRR